MTSSPRHTPTHPSRIACHTVVILSSSIPSLFLSLRSCASPNPFAILTPFDVFPPLELCSALLVFSPLPSSSPLTSQPRRTGPETVAGLISVLSSSAFQRERYMPGPCVEPFVSPLHIMLSRRDWLVDFSSSRWAACSSSSFLSS